MAKFLNAGEAALRSPSVRWNVDPVGDRLLFQEWFLEVESITALSVIVKRPNPDGEGLFADMEERLDRLAASSIEETVTALDPDEGLDKTALLQDESLAKKIRAALRSYGWVRGEGFLNGKKRRFDQRAAGQLKEPIDDVGGDWQTATDNVISAVKRAKARQADG